MDSLAIAAVAAGSYMLWLGIERAKVDAARARIPVRVVVTGTRGKSSLTRLIAAGLRGGGLKVWAKATGSAAEIIAPDGSEKPVKRRGASSILEQAELLRRAAADGAGAIVFEAMSTMPETQRVEGSCILRPTLLAITNARLDHLRGAVQTRDDMAAMLMLSAVPGTRIFVPREELLAPMAEAAAALDAELRPLAPPETGEGTDSECASSAPQGGRPDSVLFDTSLGYPEFEVNLRLALAVCAELGVPREKALAGMKTVKPDVGRFRASRFALASGLRVLAASGFAANDPTSTFSVFAAAKAEFNPEGPRVWLLNVRKDRGERSLQWIDALPRLAGATRKPSEQPSAPHGKKESSAEPSAAAAAPADGGRPDCDAVLVIGDSAQGRAVAAQLRKRGLRAEFFAGGEAAPITEAAAQLGLAVLQNSACGCDMAAARNTAGRGSGDNIQGQDRRSEIFIFGMGNIAGPGKLLVDYWEKEGTE